MRSVLVLVVCALGCGSTPPPPPANAQPAAACRDLRHTAAGADCYPYRCTAGRCLAACKVREDCGAALQGPDWPLACHSGACVPFMADDNGHPME